MHDLLPAAVPGEVLKSTETGCVVMVCFTIRNITTPSDSVTVYVVGSNSTVTTTGYGDQHQKNNIGC